MKRSTIKSQILPSILCISGLIITTLISAFLYYFGDGLRKAGDFLIVFSPSIILLISLFVSWRWHFIGGTILLIFGFGGIIGIPVLYLIVTHNSKYFLGPLLIAFITYIPIILSGILFRKESS